MDGSVLSGITGDATQIMANTAVRGIYTQAGHERTSWREYPGYLYSRASIALRLWWIDKAARLAQWMMKDTAANKLAELAAAAGATDALTPEEKAMIEQAMAG